MDGHLASAPGKNFEPPAPDQPAWPVGVESFPQAPSVRVASVDALRGLIILLMVFVNDLGPGAPSWMLHIQPPNADGMTLADVVFPSFLFIVGISIPLAFEHARMVGRSKLAQFRHVLTRSASLLFLGLVELNHHDDRTLGPRLWGLLAFVSVVLAWCTLPREPGAKRKAFLALKGLGIVGIVALLAVFRREPVSTAILFRGPVEHYAWLRTEWWGILGLIGWAYLTVATFTLILGKRREWLLGMVAILMTLHLAMHHRGLFNRVEDKAWLGAAKPAILALERAVDGVGEYVGLGDATGSLAAISMAGCVLGMILRRDSDVSTHRARIRWTIKFIVGLLLAGFLTDTFEGINKIGATPTWCFWSAAFACTLWLLLYLLMDVALLRGWSILARPAGANPLLAYFLHPITLWGVSLAGLDSVLLGYKSDADAGLVVAGSFGMALFVCVATGVLSRLGLKLRL